MIYAFNFFICVCVSKKGVRKRILAPPFVGSDPLSLYLIKYEEKSVDDDGDGEDEWMLKIGWMF